MSQLTRDELDALLKKADDICRQAQELQQRLKAVAVERARSAHPAKSAAHSRTAAARKGKPRTRR